MSGWLERYRAGERDAVWAELRELGARVRDPGVRNEVQAVCDEMARRARHNVQTIVARLTDQGYRFHTNDDRQGPEVPHMPPGEKADEIAAWLEEQFDVVPMTLLSWIRIVGDVWLVGTHPGWPASAGADPLVIEAEGSRYPDASILDYWEDDVEGWREWAEQDEDADPYVLPLAPDRLHKDNTSGGDPYGIILPDANADGRFEGERTVAFVDYLDDVFRNGGFPGAEPEEAVEIRAVLAEGLLPL